jgi:penicillin-insensitive murein DD-endopeptidase
MKSLFLFGFILIFASCTSQVERNSTDQNLRTSNDQTAKKTDAVWNYYNANHQDSIISESHGSVSHGTLENGTLIPFSGKNYAYFDTASYLGGRAFTHQHVASTLLDAYSELLDLKVDRIFKVMEMSNEHGGKLFPHRTHQNGMSVDLMTPLIKDNLPCYDLDKLGSAHYFLEFDKNGKYIKDHAISIDFDMIARHILILDKSARKYGLKISKVIFNMDLKDELFASPYGQQLKTSGIYITKNLSPLINSLHDDHYHVDFETL